jgi:hypothetical protein
VIFQEALLTTDERSWDILEFISRRDAFSSPSLATNISDSFKSNPAIANNILYLVGDKETIYKIQ